jgi:hypothetical protein
MYKKLAVYKTSCRSCLEAINCASDESLVKISQEIADNFKFLTNKDVNKQFFIRNIQILTDFI